MVHKILIFKLLFIVCVLFSSSNIYSQEVIQGKVNIIDGDTIHIGNNKIRLHGIDAPEINQICTINGADWECGKESKFYLENLIDLNNVICKVNDIDKYKRYVAICFVNNININKKMVQSGWAIAYRYYSSDYINEENKAKKNNLGIWEGEFEEPYLFRKKNK